jgi:hypothetical protein
MTELWSAALVAVLATVASPIPVAPQAPAAAQDTVAPAAVPPADSYLDATARELLEGARARRGAVDSTLLAYSTIVVDRLSASFSALRRERLLYRRELATRIHWSREGGVVSEPLGARMAIPVALEGVRVPDVGELSSMAGAFAFAAGRDRLLLGLEQGGGLKNPMAAGAEADYRFQSGDTIRIRLADGRLVQVAELRALPRTRAYDLVNGSFWIDLATHDVVRAIYVPARPLDLLEDLPDEDNAVRRIPGIVRPVQAEARRITVEYGLWDLRWWLPRLVTIDLVGSAGPMRLPVTYERRYQDYTVVGERPAGAPDRGAMDDDEPRAPAPPGHRRHAGALPGAGGVASATELAGPAWIAYCQERNRLRGQRGARLRPPPAVPPLPDGRIVDVRCACAHRDEPCALRVTVLPAERGSLLHSELLSHDLFLPGEVLVTAGELRELESALEALADHAGALARWERPRPELHWGLGGPGLLRYNRVEGPSLGARLAVDAGLAAADLTARIGAADLHPGVELGLTTRLEPRLRLAGYHRLEAAADPRMLGIGNSVNALFFGLDDGEYYRGSGAELRLRPPDGGWWELRVFGERQRAARKETDFSFRQLAGGPGFRDNFEAAPADQAGASATLRFHRGYDAAGLRWGGWAGGDGALGTFDFARGRAGLWSTLPLPLRLVAAAEAEAGWSWGELPPQALWRLGGTGTLRGFAGSAAVGESFWRGRAELATVRPAARIALFGDVGWAGAGHGFSRGRPLRSVGVGAGFLDGLVRFDLARGLGERGGWRGMVYVDGLL